MKDKTVFILAGGSDRKFDDYGARLYEAVSQFAPEPRILSCFFSSEEDTWQDKAADWNRWFAARFPNCNNYAYATLDGFQWQTEQSDVVYFHGGNTWLLLEQVAGFPQMGEWLDGKVVIGSSAGANMLSRNFWSSKRAAFGEGLGLVDRSVTVQKMCRGASGACLIGRMSVNASRCRMVAAP